MQISKNGLSLIKRFEGCRLKAYKAVKNERYYTIGYGHYGADVKATDEISQKEAYELLQKDVEKYVNRVNYSSNLYGYNFTQNQFDALVSFAYNVGGISGLTKSGKRTIEEISSSFMLYNKSCGHVLKGLTRRRQAEKELFDKAGTQSPRKEQSIIIAYEVIDGKWGNGSTRKNRLTVAGYDFKEIQSLVNKIMKGELK